MRDNFSIFSDAQVIAGSVASTVKVPVGKFAGRGEPVTIRVKVVVDFDTLTSLAVAVRQCDTVGGTYVAVDTTPAIPLADLVAGYEFMLRFLPKVEQEFIELYYTSVGTDNVAGAITAEVVEGEDFPVIDGMFFSPRNPTGAAATA